mgnify:CR=1 FL=1
MRFDEIDFEDEVLDGLYDMNFEEMTPVQEATIPVILEGSDLIACAQTGTGKTAAYTLPLLNKLLVEGNEDNVVKTLVVVPTRELAMQIDTQLQGFSYYMPVSTTVVYGGGDGTVYQNIAAAFNGISGYSFLVFNLLCAPCFAAIGAIKREMNSQKWTWFAIGYQCGFAYLIALMIYQFGCAFTGNLNVIGLICAVLALAGIIYMLVRPYKEATTLKA